MRYLLFLILIPIASYGQDIPDKNCSDFDSIVQAQGTFLAAQQVTDQRDYHGLDADGNGVACESISTVLRREYTDTSGTVTHWVDFRPKVYEVKCDTVQESFLMREFIAQSRRAVVDTVKYRGNNGFDDRQECLHRLGIIHQSQ